MSSIESLGTIHHQDGPGDPQGNERSVNGSSYDIFETDYRKHFLNTYSNIGNATYEEYAPVYRYGYNLATNRYTRDRHWNELQEHAQRIWEERNPDTWDQFKGSIYYAWDKAHNQG